MFRQQHPPPSGTSPETRPVLLSSEPWDKVWRRNQQLASRIAGTVFVEPARRGVRVRWRVEGGVDVVTPAKLLPLRWPAGRRLNAWLTARAIRARLGSTAPVTWVTHPLDEPLARALAARVVYDRTDDWPSLSLPPAEQALFARLDRALLARASAVVIVSEEMRAQTRPDAVVIPNGVDFALFSSAKPRNGAAGDRVRIGFAGTVEPFRLDLAILDDLAARRDVTLVVAGPGQRVTNAENHGAVPHSAVPALLASCHALVAPYRTDCEFNRTSDSLKLYEYFATGLPVIATPTAGFERHADVVDYWPPSGPLRTSLKDDQEQAAARSRVARNADWSIRATRMEEILHQTSVPLAPAAEVATIVVAYRSEAYIEACCRALAANQPLNSPLIIWDNASGDRAADIAEAIAPRAQIVRCPENLGFAAAVNRAALLVPGHDLLLLNPDAQLMEGSLAALVSALAANPEVAVVGCRLVGVDSQPCPDSWAFPTPARAVVGAAVGLRRGYAVRRHQGRGVDEVEGFVPFTAALVRRSVFDALRGLDERFFVYGEDADYCYRARRAGWEIAVAADATAIHVGGVSSSAGERARAIARGGDLFRELHFGRWGRATGAAALRGGASARLAWEAIARRATGQPRSRAEWADVRRHYRG